MKEKSETPTLHHKMEILVRELVEKELPIKEALKEFERIYILTTSRKFNGNKTRMAAALGVHRNTLHNLIRSLRIKI